MSVAVGWVKRREKICSFMDKIKPNRKVLTWKSDASKQRCGSNRIDGTSATDYTKSIVDITCTLLYYDFGHVQPFVRIYIQTNEVHNALNQRNNGRERQRDKKHIVVPSVRELGFRSFDQFPIIQLTHYFAICPSR